MAMAATRIRRASAALPPPVPPPTVAANAAAARATAGDGPAFAVHLPRHCGGQSGDDPGADQQVGIAPRDRGGEAPAPIPTTYGPGSVCHHTPSAAPGAPALPTGAPPPAHPGQAHVTPAPAGDRQPQSLPPTPRPPAHPPPRTPTRVPVPHPWASARPQAPESAAAASASAPVCSLTAAPSTRESSSSSNSSWVPRSTTTLVEHQDLVTPAPSRRCATSSSPLQGGERIDNLQLLDRIRQTRGLIEHQQTRLRGHRAGDFEPLPLTAGEVAAAFGHLRVVPPRRAMISSWIPAPWAAATTTSSGTPGSNSVMLSRTLPANNTMS